MSPGLPTRCEVEGCGKPLGPHKLVPLCEECKYERRQERMAASLRARAEAEAVREARRRAVADRLEELDR